MALVCEHGCVRTPEDALTATGDDYCCRHLHKKCKSRSRELRDLRVNGVAHCGDAEDH
jgi:hypothetical protein